MILLAYITMIGHPTGNSLSLRIKFYICHMILSFVHHRPSINMLLPNFRSIIIIIKLYPHVNDYYMQRLIRYSV